MTEQVVEQTPEQQVAESNAAFEAGFNKERGLPVERPEAAPVEKQPEPKVEAAPEKEPPKAEEDPWKDVHPTVKAQFESVNSKLQSIEKLPDRLRNIEGHIGGITSQLKTALAAAKTVEKTGGEAPTQAQVQAAAGDAERMKRLKEDFPEWAETAESLQSKIAALEAARVDPEAIRAEIRKEYDERVAKAERRAEESRQLARIDAKHEGWEQTIVTPEFDAWWAKQPPEIQALSSSRSASDVIRVLDAYEEHRKKAQADAEAKAKQEARLRSAVPPKGVPVQPSTAITDQDAFERGFKKARGG